MRVSIDATALSALRTGTVTYVTEIVSCIHQDRSCQDEFVLFVTAKNRHHFDRLDLDARFSLVEVPSGRLTRLLWQQTAMIWQLRQRKVTVHWGATFVLPWYAPCPCVVTVHDMTFDVFAKAHERSKRLYYPRMIRLAVARAHTVLAISNHTAQDLARIIPASVPKTRVTLLAATPPPTVDALGARGFDQARDQTSSQQSDQTKCPYPSLPLSPPFVLTVGTREPRKNLPRLLAAWQQLSDRQRAAHRLLIVGAAGWLLDDLYATAGADPTVVIAGHLPDVQLQACLEAAAVFAYPSLYEGFGLPVLEAMVHGVPVLTSKASATEEIAGDAALLIDPLSVTDIRDGLARLLSEPDLRARLAQAGRARAAGFSWARTTAQTLAALRDASSGTKATVR